MTLAQIIDLKVGDRFYWHNLAAEVLWTEYKDEIAWEFKDGTVYRSKDFGMHFVCEDKQKITIRSCHPAPNVLNLPCYEKRD